ncbi:hypothetical protein JYU34_015029 [Plutella xylostella]|uniref:Mitochondrial cytochrome c oxidase subunit VIc/VIIs domain-containing protein n=3 Tax=Plutella xylostella TaxID=51655 RepID=A0ABQ7Q636_PLUXY|nr:hypothetical protein JYU34_015029 [Plutella xylostella]
MRLCTGCLHPVQLFCLCCALFNNLNKRLEAKEKYKYFSNDKLNALMADKAIATASKPQMRGLLNGLIKRNLIVSLALAGLGGIAFQVGVCSLRKKQYAEFYRTYDAEKEFEEMRAKGLFQSC